MADTNSVLSTFRGITVGSLIKGADVWTGVFTLVGIILRSRVSMRKMTIAADESLRTEPLGRLKDVEARSAAHITRLEEKLEDQRKAYEAKLEQGGSPTRRIWP